MENRKIKRLFILATTIAIAGLLFVLFQSDIIVIGDQVRQDVGLGSSTPIQAFALTGGGTVTFLPEIEDIDVSYPVLSEIHAKLKIPRIRIEGNIVEGSDEKSLDKGFWHYPSASPFASKGNVVIIGHRYLKLPPNRDTFFHLDWVKVGDEIQIHTDRKNFVYRVREKKIVKTSDTYILEQTLNPQLTLITCHPLWTSAERLVIIADRIDE